MRVGQWVAGLVLVASAAILGGRAFYDRGYDDGHRDGAAAGRQAGFVQGVDAGATWTADYSSYFDTCFTGVPLKSREECTAEAQAKYPKPESPR